MTGCPMRRAVSPEVSDAVAVCPFLHAVKDFQGEEYAIRLAVNPFASASNPASQPIFPEDAAASVQAVFNLFHGSKGAIPLQGNKAEVAPSPAVLKPPTDSSDALLAHVPATAPPSGCPHHSMPLPMASISISGFKFLPDPGEFFNRARNARQQRPKPRRQPKEGPKNTSQSHPPASDPSPNANAPGAGGNPGNSLAASSGSAAPSPPPGAGAEGGKCPMRRIFGPLGGLLPLAVGGQMHCPPAIVAMRAAVAGLKPVRQLRPQALPIRSLAMAGTAIAANVPCGVWREHTQKFSPEWFLAVHATIPFVAMLRKAVLMPKWAILLTIAGAVAGQQVGAKMERARLTHRSQRGVRGGRAVKSCAAEHGAVRHEVAWKGLKLPGRAALA